jgi:RND family efflux transporter MFP subunit
MQTTDAATHAADASGPAARPAIEGGDVMSTEQSRKRAAIGLAAVALVAGAVQLAGCRAEAVPPLPPPTVETALVERTDSARELRMSGTIDAERSTVLSFAVPGTVEQALVDVGQRVRRGQVVARLTPTSFEHALGIALAQAQRAEDAARRLEPMHRNGTVPEVKWVEVQTSLEAATHSVELARKNLKDAVLRAPEDGVVARRNVEPGSTVAPGAPAFVLMQTRSVRAIAPVPEARIAQVRVGQPARVSVAALAREYQGTVHEVGVVADPLTRTYPVKIAVANPEGALKVGMVVDAFLPLAGEGAALVVPREAVRIDERGSPSVFVVAPDARLERRHVEVAGFLGERIALTSGVSEGERVVVSGTPMLAEGVAVRVAAVADGSAR